MSKTPPVVRDLASAERRLAEVRRLIIQEDGRLAEKRAEGNAIVQAARDAAVAEVTPAVAAVADAVADFARECACAVDAAAAHATRDLHLAAGREPREAPDFEDLRSRVDAATARVVERYETLREIGGRA